MSLGRARPRVTLPARDIIPAHHAKSMSNDRKAAAILTMIAVIEGAWVGLNIFANPERFLRFTGFRDLPTAGLLGWTLAFFCAAVFVGYAVRFPSVRQNMLRPSLLKLIAVLVAIAAGLCEESIFRKALMDALQRRGYAVIAQVLVSGLLFGLVHSIWGLFRKDLRAAAGASIATGVLGLVLAVIYVVSHRVLAPCVVAHFLINLLVEPGLVLAAVRGEIGAHSAS